MSNLRSPVKVFLSTLQKAHYRYSSSNEKVGQELPVLKQGQAEVVHKVKSDNLLNLLPYLQHMRTETISQTSATDVQLEETRESYRPEKNDLVENFVTHTAVEASNENTLSSERLKALSKSSQANEELKDPPQSLPVLITAQSKSPTAVDLNNAMLPLSLHRDKKSLLVDAVSQDFYINVKASPATGDGYLAVGRTGLAFHLIAEYVKKQSTLMQDLSIQRMVAPRGCPDLNNSILNVGRFDPVIIVEKIGCWFGRCKKKAVDESAKETSDSSGQPDKEKKKKKRKNKVKKTGM